MYTNWTEPNQAYEAAFTEFIKRVMTDREFLREFSQFHEKISKFGMWNSLSQVVVKLTSPGMPDVYQGQELWDFSLVDPDNRRPVDYAMRKGHMNALQHKMALAKEGNYTDLVDALKKTMTEGLIKMYVVQAMLHLRKRFPEMFKHGQYVPVECVGEKAKNVIAYARKEGKEQVVVLSGRFFTGLAGNTTSTTGDELLVGENVWGNTTAVLDAALVTGAEVRYRDVLTGATFQPSLNKDNQMSLPLARVFAQLPFAVLVAEPASK